jgi:tetratricopeptide (TPR) repeat protein
MLVNIKLTRFYQLVIVKKLPIRATIALWLILSFPSNCLAAKSPSSIVAEPSTTDTIADLAVKLAATDNRQQASQLFDRAVSVALETKDVAERRAALIAIASKMAGVGEKERAYSTLEQALKTVPEENTVELSAIAVDIAKVGKTKRAIQLFNRAVKLQKIYINQRNPKSYDYFEERDLVKIIIDMAKAGQIKRALQLNRTLSDELSQAEVFNNLATVAIAAGKMDAAKEYLSQALRITSKIADEDNRYIYLSNGSCGNEKFALMVAIGKNLSLVGQFDRALKVANGIYGCSSATGESTQEYQLSAFTAILNHFSKIEQVKQTWKSASKITRELHEKAEIWQKIALKLLDMGEVDLAFNIAKKIADTIPSGLSLDPPYTGGAKEPTVIAIAFKLAQLGATEKAQQLVEKIDKSLQADAKALISIPVAKKLYQEGKSTAANALLEQSLKLPQITPDASRSFDDYQLTQTRDLRQQIAVELAKIGRLEQALAITQSITEEYWPQYTITQIASALAETGDVKSAFQIADKINGSSELASFLKTIAPKLTNKEQVEQTLPILQKILADKENGAAWKNDAIAIIAPKLVEVGESDRGIALAKTTESEDIWIGVAMQLAKTGKSEQAIEIIQSLPENSAKKAEAIADLAVRLSR